LIVAKRTSYSILEWIYPMRCGWLEVTLRITDGTGDIQEPESLHQQSGGQSKRSDSGQPQRTKKLGNLCHRFSSKNDLALDGVCLAEGTRQDRKWFTGRHRYRVGSCQSPDGRAVRSGWTRCVVCENCVISTKQPIEFFG
jgi:hypothetical protein